MKKEKVETVNGYPNMWVSKLNDSIIKIWSKINTTEILVQETCDVIATKWVQPHRISVRILFNHQEITSYSFIKSDVYVIQNIDINKKNEGEIVVYFNSIQTDNDITKEELMVIKHLTILLTGFLSQRLLMKFQFEHGERIKELKGINKSSEILKNAQNIDDALNNICLFLPDAYQYPEYTVARITLDNKVFKSKSFKITPWVQRQDFDYTYGRTGTIEVFYTKEFPYIYEGPFMKEERELLINIANLIEGYASRVAVNELAFQNQERNKELRCINKTREVIDKGLTIDETLEIIVNVLSDAWQYPNDTCARIVYNGESYRSPNFQETKWCLLEHFVTFDNKKGAIEVFYTREFPILDEGPFMSDERNLINNIATLLCGFLNDTRGRIISNKLVSKPNDNEKTDIYRESLIKSRQPLQNFFNRQTLDKYIYLDMMKYKMREILFVATLYDAFNLEKEDSFFERFMGPIYQYSMFSLPRITAVSSHEQAIELLTTTQFDLVVLMVGADIQIPLELSKRIKAHRDDLPVYLLLNQKSNISHFEDLLSKYSSFDNLFVWNGDSQIFFAIVKSFEDRINAETDTRIGLVRVILLIEDSPQYYSKYLPMFYSLLFDQVNQLIEDFDMSEIDKLSKIRSRPKILWAKNYEDAVFFFNKYKDYLSCIISDAEFERNGVVDKTAGITFLEYAKSKYKLLPMILQSADSKNAHRANASGIKFISKLSERLLSQLRSFVMHNSGYGDFIFRDSEGSQIAVARNLREFETCLKTIPAESLIVHSKENQFSIWLMGRGQIELATKLNPLQIDDTYGVEHFRSEILNTFEQYRQNKKKGKILGFDETAILDEKNIVSLSTGSFGGKGRGLAFINTMINNLDFSKFTNRIHIRTPKTAIIGTDEFVWFMEYNELIDKAFSENTSYDQLKQYFMEGSLSDDLMRKLPIFLEQVNRPIAVRSSSIYEDSLTQPFAGVFDTYIISNNNADMAVRLEELITAIKLVYASVYNDKVRAYYKTINHKLEEEKMAVILQELVGDYFGDYYYPHLSGIAQSYNYYPVAHMKPEEGFAACAVGLGFYVVDGKSSFRFSPNYPKTNLHSIKNLLDSSQKDFYAVNMKKTSSDYLHDGEHAALELLDLSVAENLGTLNHCVSTFNAANNTIEPGLSGSGPRIVNFANILNYDYIPLAEIITTMLDTVEDAMGIPVEIEYAVNLNKDEQGLASFFLLQIKPLTGCLFSDQYVYETFDPSQQLLFSTSSLGNGKIDDINDVIFVDPDKFDKMQTLVMAREIEMLNREMVKKKKKYVLIGPGRWGTSDRFLGIPVAWSQISNAKVIVEMSLNDFPLDASLGSHFFHNITSMNVGYFAVNAISSKEFIKWDILKNQQVVQETTYFKHVVFENNLCIFMNGKKCESMICINNMNNE